MNPVATLRPVRSADEIRALSDGWRRKGQRVALVPTMGALHAGHLRLVEEARQRADRVIVSIFVNPAQFAPHEDFASYPRQEAGDVLRLSELGIDAVFAPSVEEMYPAGFATAIRTTGPAEGLETDFRPHFFSGVAIVVAKLLNSCRPDIAVFGEKDYQQLLVVRRLAADLNIGTEIVGIPTIREPDGLALSSRNAYLSPAERPVALQLNRALRVAAEALRAGTPGEEALNTARDRLSDVGFRVDYVALRNAETLAPVVDVTKEPLRLLGAAWLGKTRLIDNIPV